MKITDYESPKVRIIENFIPKEECDWIIEKANSTNLWAHDNKKREHFKSDKEFEDYDRDWANRVINFNILYREKKQEHREFVSKAIKTQIAMREQVIDFFKMDFPIKSESWECVRWGKPYNNIQYPHIDYVDLDFDAENLDQYELDSIAKGYINPYIADLYKRKFAHKNFTSMLYLNEDFEGGELYFPQHNYFEIKPKPGLLVIFSGDLNHLHGIKEITSGFRYVHTTFWSKLPGYTSQISYDRDNNLLDKKYYGLI